jgi:hypothetical protein
MACVLNTLPTANVSVTLVLACADEGMEHTSRWFAGHADGMTNNRPPESMRDAAPRCEALVYFSPGDDGLVYAVHVRIDPGRPQRGGVSAPATWGVGVRPRATTWMHGGRRCMLVMMVMMAGSLADLLSGICFRPFVCDH